MIYLHPFNEAFCRAIDYYKSIHPKLALRFIEDVEQAEAQIESHPKIGKALPRYRVWMLKDFPYSICYQERPDGRIYGLVLFHHRQKSLFN